MHWERGSNTLKATLFLLFLSCQGIRKDRKSRRRIWGIALGNERIVYRMEGGASRTCISNFLPVLAAVLLPINSLGWKPKIKEVPLRVRIGHSREG